MSTNHYVFLHRGNQLKTLYDSFVTSDTEVILSHSLLPDSA